MQTWGLTDPGNIRQQNQDSYAIVPFARDRVLMIVCDGMGGAKSGNVAELSGRGGLHGRGTPHAEGGHDAGKGGGHAPQRAGAGQPRGL